MTKVFQRFSERNSDIKEKAHRNLNITADSVIADM